MLINACAEGDNVNWAVRAWGDVCVGCATEEALDGVGNGQRVSRLGSYGSSVVNSTACGWCGTGALAP